jgi:methionyl-tRNA formyltransferase
MTFSISYRPEGVTNVLHADFHSLASQAGVPVHSMEGKMADPALVDQVRRWAPDAIVVVGWYHMVPRAIREIAPVYGMHASLLPDYSGGAPLVWAIINGEQRTGITLFKMDEGVDSGEIAGQLATPIYPEDTIATLYARIEELGLELLRTQMPRLATGDAVLTPQEHSKRRVFPQRKPEDGQIDWTWNARRIYDFVRAQTRPYPGAFTFHAGRKIMIWEAWVTDERPNLGALAPGDLLQLCESGTQTGLLVSTGRGETLLLTKLGLDGQVTDACEFARRFELKAGSRFLLQGGMNASA